MTNPFRNSDALRCLILWRSYKNFRCCNFLMDSLHKGDLDCDRDKTTALQRLPLVKTILTQRTGDIERSNNSIA